MAAQFAQAVVTALDEAQVDAALSEAMARFAPAFAPDRAQLARMLEAAQERPREYEAACGLGQAEPPLARLIESLARESHLEAPVVAPSARRDALGRPHNAQQILLAGLADASESPARGTDLSSVIRIVLEAMYSGLGFARTALALREPARGPYRTRASFGEPRPVFSFPTAGTGHLFAAALAGATDLHGANVAVEKVRAALPVWFARDFRDRAELPAHAAVDGWARGALLLRRPAGDRRSRPEPGGTEPDARAAQPGRARHARPLAKASSVGVRDAGRKRACEAA